jgi:hypothetical protein
MTATIQQSALAHGARLRVRRLRRRPRRELGWLYALSWAVRVNHAVQDTPRASCQTVALKWVDHLVYGPSAAA